MANSGFIFENDPAKANIVVVNTCAFIQAAVEESIGVIMELRAAAPNSILVVAGCLPLRYKDDLAKYLTEADLFITPSQITSLPTMVSRAMGVRARLDQFAQHTQGKKSHAYGDCRRGKSGRILTTTGYAYLKIADGCNRKCRYCTIPTIRGRFNSTPFDELVEECRLLAEIGAKEIVLVAQDTVRYGQDLHLKSGLLRLIQAIAEIPEIHWIRLMYLHPYGIPSGLPQLVNQCDKLLPYLDIPFQHVSETVLRAMGRPWKGDYIRKLVDNLRENIPGLVLRTTFMVGFPGEGEAEFQALLDFAESYRIEHIGVFEYSPEDGTKASNLGDPIPVEVKKHRAEELRALNLELASKRNSHRVGKKEKALIQGLSAETEYLLEGRLWDQAPEVDGVLYITDGIAARGEIHEVSITDTYQTDFFGVIEVHK